MNLIIGVYGFHEGYCTRDNIRKLTFEEKKIADLKRYWELPQQFYYK